LFRNDAAAQRQFNAVPPSKKQTDERDREADGLNTIADDNRNGS
jgi:hypothetical protein